MEFALIVPLLLVLAVGVINVGYLAWEKLALDQAVNQATRMAVAANSNGGTDGSEVNTIDKIRDLVIGGSSGLAQPDEVSIHVNEQGAPDDQTNGCADLDVGDQLRISSTQPARVIVPMPLPGWGLSRSRTLTSVAVYRCEWTGL